VVKRIGLHQSERGPGPRDGFSLIIRKKSPIPNKIGIDIASIRTLATGKRVLVGPLVRATGPFGGISLL